MPFASVNGLGIYYELHGERGEPLVLVHGYTGDVSDWHHQVAEFSPTHRVLVMDHRGHGRSHAPADRALYTIDQMADDVEAVAAHAGFERYHLLGHSMGGSVVQEIALRSPGRLLSLTLHDTGHGFVTDRRDDPVTTFLNYRIKLAEEKGMEAVAAIKIPLPPPPHMPAERLDFEKQRLARMSVHGFAGAWRAIQSWAGTEDRAHKIAARTLVICGERDAPALVKASKWLAATIPGARLELIPEASHSPQWERPALFNAALRAHVGG